MPARSDYGSVSMSMSPPPPTNLSSYSRFMHDHTKRQMEASGASPPPTNATAQRARSSGMANGHTSPNYS
ncbi:hypothetical protein FOMA001_g3472 [Fusarium oxysporum f. sp. matthiolae]|nr:hypothetical protein FOMA001_g3472 [Fusarium oxysporum f. sp. matthiolae]